MEKPKQWFIYILRCADNSLYTGITTDVRRRLQEHQQQGPKSAKYLRGRAPITLAHTEVSPNRSAASKRESEIKKLSKKDKENLIKKPSPSL